MTVEVQTECSDANGELAIKLKRAEEKIDVFSKASKFSTDLLHQQWYDHEHKLAWPKLA